MFGCHDPPIAFQDVDRYAYIPPVYDRSASHGAILQFSTDLYFTFLDFSYL